MQLSGRWAIHSQVRWSSELLNRTQFTVILVISALVWWGYLWLFGAKLSWEYVKPFGFTVAVVLACLFVFDRWIWHWAIFRGWLVATPHIDGIWDVELRSNYIDPKTKKVIGPVHGVMTVTQSYSELIVKLKTDKQSSKTIGFDILDDGAGDYEVLGVYQSDPALEYRVGSPIHYGTFKLRWETGARTNLTGHYWTDRNTSGSFRASNRRRLQKDTKERWWKWLPF